VNCLLGFECSSGSHHARMAHVTLLFRSSLLYLTFLGHTALQVVGQHAVSTDWSRGGSAVIHAHHQHRQRSLRRG